jgi:hypothetical protein
MADDEAIEMMVKKNVSLVPTLTHCSKISARMRFYKFMKPPCDCSISREFESKIRKCENGYSIGVVRSPVNGLQYPVIVRKAPYPVLRVG